MGDRRTRNLGELRLQERVIGAGYKEWVWSDVAAGPFKDTAAAKRALTQLATAGTYRVIRVVTPPVKLTQKMNPTWIVEDADLHDDTANGDAGQGEAL